MYVAQHKDTKNLFQFTWHSNDELFIEGNVVDKTAYDIIEVDEEEFEIAESYRQILQAGGTAHVSEEVAFDLWQQHQRASILKTTT